jgi:autotransporter strand-loop-strand O-heptosyltransferase
MKNTLVIVRSHSLGDTVAALPYINKFQQINSSDRIHVQIAKWLVPYFETVYPNLIFSNESEPESFDQIFALAYNFNKPIQEGYAKQLGFTEAPYIRPTILKPNLERPIKGKYVALGVHSTAQLKYWNHPNGKRSQPEMPYWNELCGLLRKAGYTPVVVEKHELFGIGPHWNSLPTKANKKVGQSFLESLNLIQHAEFYIGLSSGMSWVAHALGKPVAMIANFTEKWNEFDLNEPDYIRITDESVCHGCWNEVNKKFLFNPGDWYWCPKHNETERQFECHTVITPDRVFNEIKKWLN